MERGGRGCNSDSKLILSVVTLCNFSEFVFYFNPEQLPPYISTLAYILLSQVF